MALATNIPMLFISILSFFSLSISAGYMKDLSDTNLRECDESAIFPEPPCCGLSKRHSGRIYGGKNTELGEFPWVVFIDLFKDDDNFSGFGGGTLINSRWVLTAAHNVEKKLPTSLVVHLVTLKQKFKSDSDCVENVCGLPIEVEKIIIHEQYDSSQPIYDIALLRLAESVTFTDFIKPICLPLGAPEQYNFANKMAVVAGWGVTESGSPSDVLLKASLRVWESLSCQEYAKNVSIQICAGGVEGISACSGDSGGPLMLQLENDFYYQIGVVSYINACGKTDTPTVFENVASYIEWIKDNIMSNQ